VAIKNKHNHMKQVSSRVSERDPPVFRFGAGPKIQSSTNTHLAETPPIGSKDWGPKGDRALKNSPVDCFSKGPACGVEMNREMAL